MKDLSYLLYNTTLTDVQNEAAHRMACSRSIINALQTGCGKTTVALTAALEVKEVNPQARNLILAPQSARAAWKKELKNRVRRPYALYTSDEVIPYTNQPFCIIEQSSLYKYLSVIDHITEKPTILTIDEAHYLQSTDSKLSRISRDIKSKFPAVWLLTATPLLNEFQGLYNVLSFVAQMPSWYLFREHYCTLQDRTIRIKGSKRIVKEIVGYKNLEELSKLMDTLTIQGGRKYDILYNYIKVPLDDRLKRPYSLAAKGITDNESDKAYGARLHDLQRIADGSFHEVQSSKLSNKEVALYRLIQRIMSRGESAIVYTCYEETLSRLTRILRYHQQRLGISRIEVMSGKTPEKERVRIEETIPPSSVIIGSDACRQSRNLQRCNHLILYNIPWSVGTVIQCIGRICRVDTTYKNQFVHTIEAIDTIDTYRRMLFQDNVHLINSIFSTNPVLPTEVFQMDRENMARYKRMYLWNPRK